MIVLEKRGHRVCLTVSLPQFKVHHALPELVSFELYSCQLSHVVRVLTSQLLETALKLFIILGVLRLPGANFLSQESNLTPKTGCFAL